jgi:hypothetical protein
MCSLGVDAVRRNRVAGCWLWAGRPVDPFAGALHGRNCQRDAQVPGTRAEPTCPHERPGRRRFGGNLPVRPGPDRRAGDARLMGRIVPGGGWTVSAVLYTREQVNRPPGLFPQICSCARRPPALECPDQKSVSRGGQTCALRPPALQFSHHAGDRPRGRSSSTLQLKLHIWIWELFAYPDIQPRPARPANAHGPGEPGPFLLTGRQQARLKPPDRRQLTAAGGFVAAGNLLAGPAEQALAEIVGNN